MTSPTATLTKRSKLAGSLFAAGAVAIAVALAANVLSVAVSSEFGWKKATLLIVGCDLLIAALVVSTRRIPPVEDADDDLASLVLGAIADGVMMFTIAASTVIVLFGQSKPIERLGFFLAILVVVPLSVALAWRRQRLGLTGERLRLIAFATLVSTAVVLRLARLLALSPSATLDATLFVLLALVVCRIALALAARFLPPTLPQRVSTGAVLAATPLVLAAAAAPFVPSDTVSVLNIAVGLAAGLATFELVRVLGNRQRRPRTASASHDRTGTGRGTSTPDSATAGSDGPRRLRVANRGGRSDHLGGSKRPSKTETQATRKRSFMALENVDQMLVWAYERCVCTHFGDRRQAPLWRCAEAAR